MDNLVPSSYLTLGVLAHVDAGKTTLSEAMLYRCGAIRALGRVDHGDALLDYHALSGGAASRSSPSRRALTSGTTCT